MPASQERDRRDAFRTALHASVAASGRVYRYAGGSETAYACFFSQRSNFPQSS